MTTYDTLEGIDPELAVYVEEWHSIIEDMPVEDVQVIYDFLCELRGLPYEERQRLLRHTLRAALTPEEARGRVMAAIEAGQEPAGSLLGDWLTVDPALQAFFKVMFKAMTAPDTVLHLAPLQGIVVAA